MALPSTFTITFGGFGLPQYKAMTDEEVRTLKTGDRVRVVSNYPPRFGEQRVCFSREITVAAILTKRRSDAARAEGHMWAIVLATDTGDRQWTIESDDYLAAMGHPTHENGTRVLGCEKRI